VRYWDDTSKAPFLYNAEKRIFISYEDEQSIGLKGRYVKERGLAGIMFWSTTATQKGSCWTLSTERCGHSHGGAPYLRIRDRPAGTGSRGAADEAGKRGGNTYVNLNRAFVEEASDHAKALPRGRCSIG